jgi:hypothetical protein
MTQKILKNAIKCFVCFDNKRREEQTKIASEGLQTGFIVLSLIFHYHQTTKIEHCFTKKLLIGNTSSIIAKLGIER